ncbi:hypothetical protein QE152_g10194 [Popillia japonica]|uniref:Uncharacterized protein n=1 Tax=Popillia japonica TaxID=7064 RepID=A0AAW1LSF4_POPJA
MVRRRTGEDLDREILGTPSRATTQEASSALQRIRQRSDLCRIDSRSPTPQCTFSILLTATFDGPAMGSNCICAKLSSLWVGTIGISSEVVNILFVGSFLVFLGETKTKIVGTASCFNFLDPSTRVFSHIVSSKYASQRTEAFVGFQPSLLTLPAHIFLLAESLRNFFIRKPFSDLLVQP